MPVAILTPDPADLVRSGRWGGVFESMAAPLIEPDLHLGHAPDHGRAFADAVLAEISSA